MLSWRFFLIVIRFLKILWNTTLGGKLTLCIAPCPFSNCFAFYWICLLYFFSFDEDIPVSISTESLSLVKSICLYSLNIQSIPPFCSVWKNGASIYIRSSAANFSSKTFICMQRWLNFFLHESKNFCSK